MNKQASFPTYICWADASLLGESIDCMEQINTFQFKLHGFKKYFRTIHAYSMVAIFVFFLIE